MWKLISSVDPGVCMDGVSMCGGWEGGGGGEGEEGRGRMEERRRGGGGERGGEWSMVLGVPLSSPC